MLHKLIIGFLIAALLSSVLLTGCATPPQSSQHEDAQSLAITPTSRLKINDVWPLKLQGTYLQKIKAVVKGQEHTFSVHITLSPEKLEFVAFNDMIGRVYHLVWTPTKTTWESSEHIPDTMKPENIIVDFLLAHLPHEKLALDGAEATEEDGVRFIQQPNGLARKITRKGQMGDMWQTVTIENPLLGYTLMIETVTAE